MRKKITLWTFRLLLIGLFLLGLLVAFMLSPTLLYANKTVAGNFSVYHEKPFDKRLLTQLEQSHSIIKASELYDPELKMDVCLKDGSHYPGFVERVLGKDLLSTFYNKIVFTGDEVDFAKNYVAINGHKWNLTQMLAHVQVHCLEFRKYGLWKSNPIGGHAEWKWEGYPEYVARKNAQLGNLQNGIKKLLLTEKDNNSGWMTLPDSTEVLTQYFKYRLLVQYCLEVKNLSFVQLLQDSKEEEAIRKEMIDWYNKKSN